MGGLEEYQGNLELAETYYRKAIELSPSNTTAYIWLALFLNSFLGEYEEALELYRTASELDPVAALPRYNLAAQLNSVGKSQEAIDVILKTIEIAPTSSATYGFGAELLAFGFGRFADGLAWAQYSNAFDETFVSLPPVFYSRLGDLETAAKWNNPYIDLYPNSTFALQNKLEIFANSGEPDKAAELAQRILKKSRDTYPVAYIVSILGNYYIAEERENDAVELYNNFFPELFGELPNVNRVNVEAAVNLIRLDQMADIAGVSSVMAERSLEVIKSMPRMAPAGKSILDVELHAITGNRDAAVAAFAEALDSGWYRYLSPLRSFPNLESIADDPEFIRLLARNQQRVDQELAKVREMERNGQLARTPEELPDIEFDIKF
jgi:tetratricopeptide (TPR) repeat protein